MTVSNAQMVKYINGVLDPNNAEKYTPMELAICRSYINPLLM